jgi:hypothetical protein
MPRPVAQRADDSRASRLGASFARSSTRSRRARQVFLNVPFDDIAGYEDCYLAYIAGLVGIGLTPRSVLEIPSGRADRVTRIFRLMRQCRYSIHDLSRTQWRAGTPRFNMPFEAGLATALSLMGRPAHDRYVFASDHRLVQRAASDLGGVDVYAHGGTARGAIAAMTNAFVRRSQSAVVSDLFRLHRRLRDWTDREFRRARPRRSLYEPAVFRSLVVFATRLARG